MTSTPQSGRPVAKISLGEWTATSKVGATNLGLGDQLPQYMRAYFLAMAGTNRIGHAQFASGDLAKFLGRVDPDSGTRRPIHGSQVTNVINDAIRKGLLDGESCARCLVLPLELAECGRGASSCFEHGINTNRTHRRRITSR